MFNEKINLMVKKKILNFTNEKNFRVFKKNYDNNF